MITDNRQEEQLEIRKEVLWAWKITEACLDRLRADSTRVLDEQDNPITKCRLETSMEILSLEKFEQARVCGDRKDISNMMLYEINTLYLKEYMELDSPLQTIATRLEGELIARTLLPWTPGEDDMM